MKFSKASEKRLKLATTSGYTDEDYDNYFRGFFMRQEVLNEMESIGLELIDYKDSIFYFKKDKQK